MLPEEFPPWQTVYYHFRKWRKPNLLQRVCDRIRRAARVAAGRDPSPSAAVIDTQSARAERQGGPSRGRDPNKQVTGRKRHVIVDTLGLLLAVVVHPAGENDAQSAPPVLGRLLGQSRTSEGDICRQRVQGPSRRAPLATGSLASFHRGARWRRVRLWSAPEAVGNPSTRLVGLGAIVVWSETTSVLGSFPTGSGRCPSYKGKSTYQLLNVQRSDAPTVQRSQSVRMRPNTRPTT